MNFVVNDIAATPEAGGVYSILSDFYLDVLKNDHTNQWYFILAGKYFPESDNVKILVRNDLKKSKLKKLFFEKYNGSKYINALKPDVFISLQNIATRGINATCQIVYLHQPIPFQKQKKFSYRKRSERKLAFYQRQVGNVIKNSISKIKPNVIVQTEWMKRALTEQTTLPQNKVAVIHPRVNVEKNIKIIKNKSDSFFYPASNFLYKNHRVIDQAISYLENDGIENFNVTFTLNPTQLPYRRKQIKYIGHVSRKEVMKMYENKVLLFPSYIESFGLPLIEAAVHADVILAADTEFAHELLANYNNVYYYKYDDSKELSHLMKKVINGEISSDGKALTLEDNGETLYDSIMEIVNDK